MLDEYLPNTSTPSTVVRPASMEGKIVAEITFPEGAQGNEEFVEFRAQVNGPGVAKVNFLAK
jgi:hypothetical protein